MQGRNGVDQFARFTMGVALAAIVLTLFYWDQKWNRRISGSVWDGCHCLYLFQDFFKKYFQTLSGESEVSSDDR